MITLDEFHNFIERPLVYEQKLISIIDHLSRQIYLNDLGQFHSNYGKTIKVEGMEKYNPIIFQKTLDFSKKFSHYGPVTCHVFRSFEDSKSFLRHTDPDDVIIEVLHGEFDLHLDSEVISLKSGDNFFISANTPHWAIHKKSCLFLSFGLEKFLIDKL